MTVGMGVAVEREIEGSAVFPPFGDCCGSKGWLTDMEVSGIKEILCLGKYC